MNTALKLSSLAVVGALTMGVSLAPPAIAQTSGSGGTRPSDSSAVVQLPGHPSNEGRPAAVDVSTVKPQYLGFSTISSARWVYHRNFGFTLEVSPTGWLRANAGGYAAGASAWGELYDKYKDHGLTKNLGGMRDQLICHVQFAAGKSTYNLDEWRADVSYAETVNTRCNPGGTEIFD